MRLLTAPRAGLAAATCAVAGLTGCATGGSTPAAANSAQASAAAASTGHPGPGAGAASATARADGRCQSLVVPASVKAAITQMYGAQSVPPLVHIAPVPGTFYYGRCGSVFYAAARFEPTHGATEQENIAMQDDGAEMQYFSRAAAGGWRQIAAHMATRAPRGCSVIRQIPAQLTQLWDDCRAGELPW